MTSFRTMRKTPDGKTVEAIDKDLDRRPNGSYLVRINDKQCFLEFEERNTRISICTY